MLNWTRSFFLRGVWLVLLFEILVAGAVALAALQLAKAELSRSDAETAETLFEDMLAVANVSKALTLEDVVARRSSSLGSDDLFLLIDANDRVIAGNLARWPTGVPASRTFVEIEATATAMPDSRKYGVFAATLDNGSQLLVGHSLERSERSLTSLRDALLKAVLLAFPLAVAAAWLVVKLVDSRLRDVEDALEKFNSDNLSQRIELNGSQDTFDRLGEISNRMMDRIAELVEELRIVTDSVAHDLRMPLTRLKNRLTEAQASDDIAVHVEINELATNELDHVLSILTQMLQIGRAEAGIGREAFVAVDLSGLVHDMAEIFGPVAEDADRSLTSSGAKAASVTGQPDLLARALSNLVENALSYGRGAIAVKLHDTGDAFEIAVEDEGPGIPPEHEAKALRRFGRLDPARAGGGSGLGLALASAVMRLHGGTLLLARSKDRFAVILRLPKSPGNSDYPAERA